MDATRDEHIEDLIEQIAADPQMPRPAGTAPADWEDARALAPVAAALRALAEVAPPLAHDPLAAALGLT